MKCGEVDDLIFFLNTAENGNKTDVLLRSLNGSKHCRLLLNCFPCNYPLWTQSERIYTKTIFKLTHFLLFFFFYLNRLGSHLSPSGTECYITSDMFYVEVQLDINGLLVDVKVAHQGENPTVSLL